MTDVRDRARSAGLIRDWQDAKGTAQQVSDAALEAILACLDTDTGDAQLVSADIGDPIVLPPDWRSGPARWLSESGEARDVTLAERNGEVILAEPVEPGYYQIEQGGQRATVAIAPRACPAPPTGCHWGSAVQIPSLREGGGAYGDFASLATAATALGRAGAAALAISPVHALFPSDATRYSPYAPSSRLFRNAWLAPAGEPVDAAGDLIDWSSAAPDRMRDLRIAYDRLDGPDRTQFEQWRQAQGEPLQAHAVFTALDSHFHARTGVSGWRHWPAAYRDPTGAAVRSFIAEHDDAIRFHGFAQWHADQSLERAAQAARAAGMAIGLITDLAIGVAGDGADSWSRPQDLLTGLSIGAPPDPLGPEGQNWGITALSPFALKRQGFAPFIQTLRAVFAHAGGVRIDHALGLARLWVVPEGQPADQGAYLTMPLDHMLRILKIEASRANDGRGAIVIGEDLGTVPPGFRDRMAAAGMLGMRVLPFERDDGGDFLPPDRWSPGAIAMTATHDVATVAGWWQGRDLEWRATIAGQAVPPDQRDERAADRIRLWNRMGDGPLPDRTGPVVDAAIAAVAATPCPLAIIPAEDLLGLTEQPNLPGTTDEHPNWRRRLPDTLATSLADPPVAARIATLNAR